MQKKTEIRDLITINNKLICEVPLVNTVFLKYVCRIYIKR
jgi:hypothetical protein